MWGIDPDVANRVPLNGGVNHIHYSLNHGKKLATNCAEVGHLLKVVVLASGTMYAIACSTSSQLQQSSEGANIAFKCKKV